MRYGLRTLLIVISLASVLFGWAAYLRQKERYHSQEAANLIRLIAEGFHIPSKGVRETVERMALDKGRPNRLNNKTAASFQKPLPVNTDVWASAIYHQRMSTIYGKALSQPWVLFSKPPLNQIQQNETETTEKSARSST